MLLTKPLHVQTVKAITMIGLLQSKVHGKEAGIEWSRRELRIREELQVCCTYADVC
jgi:hypothetical protein